MLVALVGTFLPVPMAFDVVIAYVAMSRRSSPAVCRDDFVHAGNLQRVFVFGGGENDIVEDCG